MNYEDQRSLKQYAEMYEDAQKARIAAGNRIASGTIDSEVAEMLMEAHVGTEKLHAKYLHREYRRVVPHSLRAWQQSTVGIGEHLLARLLGCIGDPATAYPHHWEQVPTEPAPSRTSSATAPKRQGRVPKQGAEADQAAAPPLGARGATHGRRESHHLTGALPKRVLVPDPPYVRGLHQLWSYCGHGDVTRRKRAGMTQAEAFALGNPRAKTIVHLLAEGCMKINGGEDKNGKPKPLSPYRAVYDAAKAASAGREGWTPMHQHNDALRRVGKEVLRDLWKVALAAHVKEDLAA